MPLIIARHNDMYLNRFCYLLLIFAAVGSIFTSHPVAMWFLLANVLTLAIYGIDKTAARKTWRRVPESTLLVFGVVGGWPGAIVGQQLFRHKTQKQPFKTYFIVSVIVSILVTVAIYRLYPFLSY
ncbi:cyanate transport [Salmonella enterica subsp. enterica serovar Montevideo str. CFSAN004346]|nr:cyanate transport [Salmonella enterica subsp. enterica serovar Montevideo str. CFSAN004346]